MQWSLVAFGLLGLPSVLATPSPMALFAPNCCAADRCFAAARLPASSTPKVSQFCASFIHSTPSTTTVKKTATITKTVTPALLTVTVPLTISTTVATVVSSGLCTTTSTAGASVLPTSVYYQTRTTETLKKRGQSTATPIPSALTAGCHGPAASISRSVSSACSCFLTRGTTTSTSTSTVTVTASSLGPVTVVTTIPVTVQSAATTCSSTTTVVVISGAATCGPATATAVTSGTLTCSGAPPGETAGRLRIEGLQSGEGTIFEDCISSGPVVITTPSGGSHECDGTNNDANASPGATCTSQLNAAAQDASFGFDGTYDAQYQDYFITSIDATTQTSTQFWGILQDRSFTPVGGCEQEIQPGGTQQTLWAFDAFNANGFLGISPDYAVVTAGTSSVTVTVTSATGNGDAPAPFQGASISEGAAGSTTSGADGSAIITVPTVPGCYQYKAVASGKIASNAFYLTVL